MDNRKKISKQFFSIYVCYLAAMRQSLYVCVICVHIVLINPLRPKHLKLKLQNLVRKQTYLFPYVRWTQALCGMLPLQWLQGAPEGKVIHL